MGEQQADCPAPPPTINPLPSAYHTLTLPNPLLITHPPTRSYTDVAQYSGWIQQQLAAAAADAVMRRSPSAVPPAAPPVAAAGPPAPASDANPAAPAVVASSIINTDADSGADAPPASAAATSGCSCTLSGASGRLRVGKAGCKQHGLEGGDDAFFCYVKDPSSCARAVPSTVYLGAAWVSCAPAARLAAAAAKQAAAGGGAAASRVGGDVVVMRVGGGDGRR